MKKGYWIGIALVLIVIAGIIFFVLKNNNSEKKISENNSNYETKRSSTSENISNNSITNSNIVSDNISENSTTIVTTATSEEEIASFSTKIYTKDSNRQNNVSITCSTLNNTEIAAGSTFSFCDTVGKATSAKGYKEADIFTSDGEKTKGLGGGNCQVSTTLYNAVLKVPELKVTERHEHSNSVPYIQSGKDAAVAFGSYDFKFVNTLDSTIKIQAENTPDSVTIKLIKISLQ